MMDQEPDMSSAVVIQHFSTWDEAKAYVERAECDAIEEGVAPPALTVEPDRPGGWNVIAWEC